MPTKYWTTYVVYYWYFSSKIAQMSKILGIWRLAHGVHSGRNRSVAQNNVKGNCGTFHASSARALASFKIQTQEIFFRKKNVSKVFLKVPRTRERPYVSWILRFFYFFFRCVICMYVVVPPNTLTEMFQFAQKVKWSLHLGIIRLWVQVQQGCNDLCTYCLCTVLNLCM
jgi:hypothetical protein